MGNEERMLTIDDLIEVKLSKPGDANIYWIADMPLSVPKEVLEHSHCETVGNITFVNNNGEYRLNVDTLNEADRSSIVSQLRTCRMFTDVPFSSKLPFSYQLVPQILRITVARFIGRRARKHIHRWAKFPSFPLDLSVDALSDILAIHYKKLKPTPIILTHDIDNPASFQKLPEFLKEEERVDARSTNFVVPFKWPLDYNLLSEIRQRGHEVGIHGFDHGNKTPFLSEIEMTQRIEKMRHLVERYAIKGYRSPSLLRTRKLLQELSRMFKYDSSISTAGGLFPVPNNGCATARMFKCEGMYEIPVSLPSDAKLFLLGYKPHEIINLWITCAEKISQSGGIVVLLIHSDTCFFGNRAMFSLYRELLQHFRHDERFTFKTCGEPLNTRDGHQPYD
jgi:peptidoglycan/xylan/chitin deacetylase (PgdA/CDA1 family)